MFIPTKENYTDMTPTDFEQYTIAELSKQFSSEGVKDFSFQHDVTLNADDGSYQIDGRIEYSLMGVTYVTLVECKRYKGPVKREHIQVLHDKIRSTGAHKGIFVTTSYNQSGALQYANKHGIALISIVDGKMKYYARDKQSMNRISIPPWASVNPFEMILQSQISDATVRSTLLDDQETLLSFITVDNSISEPRTEV